MRTNIIAELLEDRGYEVEVTNVIKNGIEKIALIVKSDTFNPTFYVEDMEDKSDLDIVDNIVDFVNNGVKPDIDIRNIADRDFILANVIPAIQHESNEDIVKYNLLDLEIYFRVVISNVEGMASYKVSADLLERANIDKEELFNTALRNIEPHIHVCSLARMLSQKMGVDIADDEMEIPLYVAYSDFNNYGASAMLSNNTLGKIADMLGTKKLAIIPSSIEEILILKLEEEDNAHIEELNSMIVSVNEQEVSEDLYLSSHVYIWDNGELRLANC